MFLSFFGGYFVWVFGSETATKQSWHLGSDLFIQGLGLLELQDKEKPFLVPLSLSLSLSLSKCDFQTQHRKRPVHFLYTYIKRAKKFLFTLEPPHILL